MIVIMCVDILETQGTRTSVTMAFIMLNRINSVPASLSKIKNILLYHHFSDMDGIARNST